MTDSLTVCGMSEIVMEDSSIANIVKLVPSTAMTLSANNSAKSSSEIAIL